MFSQFKFVTGNLNKVREARDILKIPLEQVEVNGLFEIQTQELDELVRHKCQQAYEALKSPVLVEDSALQFKAWKGLPGPLVKWLVRPSLNGPQYLLGLPIVLLQFL